MTPERFAYLFDESIEKCRQMAVSKGGEYAPGGDRLANFKTNGERLGLHPMVIWGVYAGKHWDAIQTYIKDQVQGKDRKRSEPIEGRLIDLIVYGFLGLGLLEEGKPAISMQPSEDVKKEMMKLCDLAKRDSMEALGCYQRIHLRTGGIVPNPPLTP